jgi:NADPH-dependent 2,4-dienoyl-CoA reductase/sulfur reductase-like enzyme
MITAVVTAIAITQREARREKAAKEAEAAAAAKKDILVVGAGITGLVVALFCRAQGFTVTIVDRKSAAEFLQNGGGGLVWLGPTATRALRRVHEKFPEEMREAACNTDVYLPVRKGTVADPFLDAAISPV